MKIIKINPTPYQQYLLDNGYLRISGETKNGIRREYLAYGMRCLLCGQSSHEARLDSLEETKNGGHRFRLYCIKCRATLGYWYDESPSGNDGCWNFTPTEETDIFHNMFDIKLKIKRVLLGDSL